VLDLVREACGAGKLPAETDVAALGDVVASLLDGYLLQRRIIGAVSPDRSADTKSALLHL
jgi:hypothetical protein